MQKSQIFLASSAVVLAVAGAFATKANHNRRPLITVGTKGDLGSACVNIQQQRYTSVFATGEVVARTLNNVHTFFTAHYKNPNNHALGYTCQKITYTKAE